MSKDSPFDLDRELARVLAALGDKKLVGRGCLDELEAHLRDELDDRIAAGEAPEQAFHKACQAFGAPEALLGEYATLYAGNRRAQLRNLVSHVLDERQAAKALIGLALGAAFLLLGLILEGGHLSSVLSVTSFFLVTGAAVGMTMLHSPPAEVARAYAAALKGDAPATGAFRTVGRNFLNAGLAGALIGFVQVVRSIREPEQIGPALAIAIVSLIYGFLGYLVFGLSFEASVAPRGDAAPMRLKHAAGAAILLAALPAGCLWLDFGGERLRQFVNVPALLIVAAGVLVVAMFVRRVAKAHLPYLANGALVTGLVGAIFHFIHVLENLDKPKTWFVGLSVALLPLLYSALVAGVLRSAAGERGAAERKPQALLPYYAATVAVLAASITIVIYAISLPPA